VTLAFHDPGTLKWGVSANPNEPLRPEILHHERVFAPRNIGIACQFDRLQAPSVDSFRQKARPKLFVVLIFLLGKWLFVILLCRVRLVYQEKLAAVHAIVAHPNTSPRFLLRRSTVNAKVSNSVTKFRKDQELGLELGRLELATYYKAESSVE